MKVSILNRVGSSFKATPIEQRMGRIMRAPDHPDAGGGTENNQGGNSGDQQQNGESTENNNGQPQVTDAFWDDPSDASSDDNSAGNGDSSGGDRETQSRQFGQQLQQSIDSLNFEAVFTPEMVAEMGEGKFDSVNTILTKQLRQATQQSVIASAKVMAEYGRALREEFQGMIDAKLGNRDNDKTLMDQFPQAASNPKLRPMIKSTFEQAMKHTKGNRAAALDMTRSMLTEATKVLGTELDITSPPGGSGDNPPSSNSDFLAELMGR